MKKLLLVIWLACLAVGISARGQNVLDTNNTIVRLSVTVHGTNFGHIDLELFDQQKPETVRNFLMYVYSGSYSNMIIHDLQPGQTLRAGHVLPDGTNELSTFFERVQSFGTISNEFFTGPELANDFGTLALVPTNFHGSASIGSMDWVINLTNNSSFNAANPYVVFGRVVNTQGPLNGTNLLNYFNTFRSGTNLRGVAIGIPSEVMFIPVTQAYPQRFPNTAEMYLLTASVLQSGVARDQVAPSVEITAPTEYTTNGTPGLFPFTGTADDNQHVARVLYDYGLPYQRFTADGTTSWSSNIFLFGSTNTISVRSVDDFGNLSAPVERKVFHPFIPINLVTTNGNGKGRITGLTNNQIIRLGTTYQLRAKAKPGNYFLGWLIGDTFSSAPVINLTIPPENWFVTNIYAFFGKTFIGLSNGTYQGIFFPLTNGAPRNAGWISLNLSPNGNYVGVLRPIGSTFQIRGRFDGSGNSIISDSRGALQLGLSLTDNPAGEVIVGYYQNGTVTSGVVLYRVQKFSSINPAPSAGTYSFLISPTVDSTVLTGDAYGFGSVTIDSSGKIKMTGMLGDEEPIKQNAKLLKNNQWPFYALANGGREAVLGWASLDESNRVTADVRWWAPHFPGETNQNARLNLAPFSNSVPLLNWTNGTLTFFGDNVPGMLTSDVTLNDDGSVTVLSNTNNVQLSVPDAKGQISGTFTHPISGQVIPLRGAALQSSNIIGGFSGMETDNGGFVIRRRP